jgi:hypothetical protein
VTFQTFGRYQARMHNDKRAQFLHIVFRGREPIFSKR